jgi:carboxymethylenebutenolidase
MCFAYDAHPPDLPQQFRHPNADGGQSGQAGHPSPGLAERGVAASGEDLVLTAQDGARFAAYLCRPEAPNGAGIVILPDVRGLFPFYKELAERFAVAGIEAITIDYFGRTAGLAPRDESFDYMAHVQQTVPEQIAWDVAAAVAYLRQMPGQAPRAIFTVGFCFGGGQSFQQAANHLGLAGVIGFYGPPKRARSGPSPIERIGEFECPVLGLYGGADQGIPLDDVKAFDEALGAAGVEHEIVVYPGAPHSFFDKHFAEFQEQCANAWLRMLQFIGAHTPKAQA